jgi:RNA polymerase primary sigma factor
VHERRVKLARKLRHVEEALGAVEASVSLNLAVGEDGGGELGDLFADPTAADPAEEAGESLRREAVRAALHRLPDRERRILELRFGFDGEQQPLESIGRELGLTRERVRQLERQGLSQLAHELEGLVDVAAGELAASA